MAIKKILIVDDSPTERHFLGELLTKHGFQIMTLESGEEAVAKAADLMPDLILMDVGNERLSSPPYNHQG